MKKTRILSLILAFVMIISLLSTAAFAANVKDFTDLDENAWYYEYVERVVADEYFKGIGGNLFDPTGLMTRSMFVTVLHRVAGCPAPKNTEITFPDVEADKWYTEAVLWGVEEGVILGYGVGHEKEGYFGTTDNVTREQMCAFMDRYIDWHNAKFFKLHDEESAPIAFTDAADITWGKEEVEKCVAYGLINGIPVSETEVAFKPLQNSSRAEVAKVIACLAWKTALSPDDLIGHAVRNSMNQIADNYIGRTQDYIADSAVSAVTDYISADLFNFRTEIIDGARPQYMSVGATLDKEVITKLVTLVVEYAFALAGPEESLPTKAEVIEVVKDVKAEVEAHTGLNLSEASVSTIAEYVYTKVSNAAGSIWSNFKNDDGYVTGDITVSVGDFSAVVNVDEETGVSVDGKLAAVKGMAIALAKELYASINAQATDWTNEFENVSVVVTIEFSASDSAVNAAKTANFPYVYPVTLSMTLENNVNAIQYKYDGMPNVKFVVSEKVQNTYEAAVQAAIDKILSSETVINKVESFIAPTLDSVKDSEQIAALADVLDATNFPVDGSVYVSTALTSWKNANLYKDGSIAYSPVYEMYWAENADADWDNNALYAVVSAVANSTAAYVENMIEAKATELAEGKGDLVSAIIESVFDALRANITPADVESLLNGESIGIEGLDGYDISIGSLDLNSVPAGAKDYVVAVICDRLREANVFATADVEAAMKADIDGIINDTVAGTGAVEKLSSYLAKGNFFTEVDEIAGVQVRNFATLIRYASNKVATDAADGYVAKICKQISKLPADASITINGVVFEEYNPLIQNIKNAATLDEACEALAQLIEQPGIGDLCINSFADGIVFSASYGARSYSFKLFIEVQ